jgi:hypothetical protein
MDLFDGWKPSRYQREQLGRVRRWEPRSRCDTREDTALCVCDGYVCTECLEAHFDEDAPDFCAVLRLTPDLWVEWDAGPPPLLCSRKEVNSMDLFNRSKSDRDEVREILRFPKTGFVDGGDRSSQVPGGPAIGVPCSLTPAGPLRSATAALRCCLPSTLRRRLPR